MSPLLGGLVLLWDILVAVFSGEEVLEEPQPSVRAELWAEAFRAAGMDDIVVRDPVLGPVTGQAGRIRMVLRAEEGPHVLSVEGLELEDRELEIRSRDYSASSAQGQWIGELEAGDPSFEYHFFVRGEPRLVHGLLDAEARRLLLRLVGGAPRGSVPRDRLLDDVRLTGGSVEASVPPLVGRAPRVELIQTLLDLSRRLVRPADLAHGLASNVSRDPLPEVRLANLDVLAREYAGRPATLEALRRASSDPAPEVRVRAAIELGEDGLDTLREVATAGEGAEGPQAQAIRLLGAQLSTPAVMDSLDRALRARRAGVAEVCLTSLGERGGPAVIAPLVRVLAVERGPLAAAAARALGVSGEPSSEGTLLAALDRVDEGVALGAVEALSRVGTASAVPPLRRIEESSGEDSLGRAARLAVMEIQSRLTGASPGQLSLSAAEGGQLSVAEDEAGRVSLPHNPAGSDESEGSS